jgi:hypothetical protein
LSSNTVSVRFDALGGPGMVTQVKTITTSVDGLRTSLGTLKTASLPGGQAFTGALGGFNQSVMQAEKVTTSFRARLSSLGGALSQNATSFGVATASIWGVYNAYDNLVKIEIRAESATNRVRTMTTTLAALEERRRIGLEKGNLTAAQVEVLDSRIADTKAKLATAQAREADLQGDVNEAWANFASTIGPQVVAAGGSIIQMVNSLNLSFAGRGGMVNAIKNGLAGLIPGFKSMRAESLLLKPALGGIGAAGATLPALFGNMGTGATAMSGGLNKATFAAGGLGRALLAILGPIGLAIAGASLLIAGIQDMENRMKSAGFKPKGFAKGLIFASPEEKKGAEDELRLWDEIIKKKGRGVSLLELTGGPFGGGGILTDKNEVDALKKGGILDQGGGIMEKFGTTTEKAANATKLFAAIQGSSALNQYVAVKKAMDANSISYEDAATFLGKLSLNTANYNDVVKKGDAIVSKSVDTNAKLTASTGVQSTIEQQMAAARAALTDSTVKNMGAQTELTGAWDVGATAIENQRKETILNAVEQEAARHTLLEYVKASNIAIDTDSLRTAELKLVQDAYLGDQEALEKLSQTTIRVTDGLNQQVEGFLRNRIAVASNTATLSDSTIQHRLYLQGVLKGVEAAKEWSEQLLVNIQAASSERGALQANAIAMGAYANVMAFSTEKMKELITVQVQMTKARQDEAIAMAKNTGFLRDNSLMQAIRTDATLKGIRSANDWTVSMISSTQAAKDEHAQLLQLAADMLQIPINASLTSDQLKTLMTTFQTTGDAAGALSTVLGDQLAPAFDRLAEVFSAKSFKDMKEALKGLELGELSGMEGKLSKALKPIQKLEEAGREAANQFSIMVAAISVGADKIKNKSFDALQGSLQKIADTKGVEKPVDDIIASLKKMTPEQVSQHAGSIEYLFEAIKGGFDSDEQAEFVRRYQEEVKKIGPSAQGSVSGVDNLADAVARAHEKFNVATPKSGSLIDRFTALSESTPKDEGQGKTPTKATLNIEEATGNITRLMGNFNGWLSLVASANPIAKLNIGPATGFITRLIGNFDGWFQLANKANPGAKLNIVPATGMITRLIGNFNGWLSVAAKQSAAKLSITTATSNITRLIGNFNGFVSLVNKTYNIKVNNSDAMSKINSVKNGLSGIKDKNISVRVGLSGPGVHLLAHGMHGVVDKPTLFLAGEAGPEKVDVSPTTGPPEALELDRQVLVNQKVMRPSKLPEIEHVRERIREGGGEVIVNINSPIYLYPGGEQVGKFHKKYQLNNLSRFPMI